MATNVANKLVRGAAAAVRIVETVRRTRSLTYVRLYRLAKRVPYYTPGIFRFPFGAVEYVDAGTLPFLYAEIFGDRVYEVAGLGDAPRIIDCGGNVGLSAIWFKRRYPGARLTVFEADPAIAQVAARNVRKHCSPPVEVVPAAVQGQAGTVTFRPDRAIGGRVTAGQGTPIPAIRLATYLTEPVDLLKMDIEGSEFATIADLCATGAIAKVRNLICEVHDDGTSQDAIGQLWRELSGAGFHLALNDVKTATDDPDPNAPTPFTGMPSAAFAFLLYAWRDPGTGLSSRKQ